MEPLQRLGCRFGGSVDFLLRRQSRRLDETDVLVVQNVVLRNVQTLQFGRRFDYVIGFRPSSSAESRRLNKTDIFVV